MLTLFHIKSIYIYIYKSYISDDISDEPSTILYPLQGGAPAVMWMVVLTILKTMSSSMERMTSHIWNGKMFETTNQVMFVGL